MYAPFWLTLHHVVASLNGPIRRKVESGIISQKPSLFKNPLERVCAAKQACEKTAQSKGKGMHLIR